MHTTLHRCSLWETLYFTNINYLNKQDPDLKYETVPIAPASVAKINGIDVAGKTGTVENFILIEDKKRQLTDHSTFIAFAPANDPKIVVSVFIENGYWGSRWAAPIASLIIEKYLTNDIKRKWLENRMLNGSLLSEYEKPYLSKSFSINE